MHKNLRLIVGLIAILGFSMGCVSSQAQSGLDWKSLSKAQKLAEKNNKKVMIFAEAEWCGYCKKMHNEVFPESTVQDSLHKYFYPVKLDIESDRKIVFNDEAMTERQLARRFRISSTPTFIFLSSGGNTIGGQPGFLPAEIFDKLVSFVGSDLTGRESFKVYLKKHGVEVGDS